MADNLPPPPAGYALSDSLPPPPAGYTLSGQEKGPMQRFIEKTPVGPLFKASDNPADGVLATLGKNAAALPATIAKGVWNPIADHLKDALSAAESGNHTEALGHFLKAAKRVYDPGGTMAEDSANSVIHDLGEGNIAGALGTASPFIVGGAVKAAPAVAGAVENAGSDLAAASQALLKSPGANQSIPGTTSMPPMLVDALKLHPKTAAAGNLLQRLENAKNAVVKNQSSRLPVQIPEGGWPEAAPPEPAPPLTPQQSAVIEATVAARTARSQALAAQPVNLDWSGLSDPATLEQAARQLAANRASRAAANPQSAAATIDRIKAIGGTKATPSMGDLAVPRDLNSQLQNYLGKLRAFDPDYEGQPAPEPELSDLLQQSLDAIKAKAPASNSFGDMVKGFMADQDGGIRPASQWKIIGKPERIQIQSGSQGNFVADKVGWDQVPDQYSTPSEKGAYKMASSDPSKGVVLSPDGKYWAITYDGRPDGVHPIYGAHGFEYWKDGARVGVARLTSDGKHLSDVAVMPWAQGRGIGKQLLSAVRDSGIKTVKTSSISEAGARLLGLKDNTE